MEVAFTSTRMGPGTRHWAVTCRRQESNDGAFHVSGCTLVMWTFADVFVPKGPAIGHHIWKWLPRTMLLSTDSEMIL